MEIKISNISSIPIYQQIANSIKNKILSKEYISNTQLPSIRSLAKELEVGISTITGESCLFKRGCRVLCKWSKYWRNFINKKKRVYSRI